MENTKRPKKGKIDHFEIQICVTVPKPNLRFNTNLCFKTQICNIKTTNLSLQNANLCL